MEELQQISKILANAETIDRRLSHLQNELDISIAAKKRAQSDIYYTAGAIEAITLIIEKVNEKSIDKMMGLVNDGMNIIFDDRTIWVEHEVKEFRGSSVLEFYSMEKKGEDVIRSNIRTSQGEGVRTIVGLCILHYYIEINKANRIIVLDEVVSAVADMYLINLFMFMKKLAEEGGYSYLLIEHDSRIDSYIDNKYIMQNGVLNKS